MSFTKVTAVAIAVVFTSQFAAAQYLPSNPFTVTTKPPQTIASTSTFVPVRGTSPTPNEEVKILFIWYGQDASGGTCYDYYEKSALVRADKTWNLDVPLNSMSGIPGLTLPYQVGRSWTWYIERKTGGGGWVMEETGTMLMAY